MPNNIDAATSPMKVGPNMSPKFGISGAAFDDSVAMAEMTVSNKIESAWEVGVGQTGSALKRRMVLNVCASDTL